MRIVLAVVTGVLIAALLSFGVVQMTTSASPVGKPLYNYGTR